VAKGQIIAGDYIVAASVISLLFASSVIMWWKVNYQIQQDFMLSEMKAQADSALKLLIRSPGTPLNWSKEVSNVSALGLAKTDRVLSQAKVNAIKTIEYDRLRNLLGVGGHHVYVKVSAVGGSLVTEAGQLPDGQFVVNSRRASVLDGKPVFVDVSVWDRVD